MPWKYLGMRPLREKRPKCACRGQWVGVPTPRKLATLQYGRLLPTCVLHYSRCPTAQPAIEVIHCAREAPAWPLSEQLLGILARSSPRHSPRFPIWIVAEKIGFPIKITSPFGWRITHHPKRAPSKYKHLNISTVGITGPGPQII